MDGVHHERPLDGGHRPDPRVAGLQFLHQQAVGPLGEVRQAVAVQVRRVEAQFAHLGDEVGGEGPLQPVVADVRPHAVLDELPGGVPDHPFLLVEVGLKLQVIEHTRPLVRIGKNARTGGTVVFR